MIPEGDLRVEVWRGASVAVRVTHVPTGRVVVARSPNPVGSSLELKQEAIAELESELAQA